MHQGEFIEVPLTDIKVTGPRLRQVRPEVVDQIAASMAEIGQLQPVTLTQDKELVIGEHRTQAARKLGWTSIKARIVNGRSANELRLMEIDENLMRGDLSPVEQATHHGERKKIYLRLHPETQHGANQHTKGESRSPQFEDSSIPGVADARPQPASTPIKPTPKPIQRYTAEAASKTGISEQTVQRAVARAAAIPNIASLANTSLDKGVELDALVKLTEPKRQALVDRAVAGEKVSAVPEVKKAKREEKEAALAEKTITAAAKLGTSLYSVIYADPPWRFEPYSRETGLDRSADNHYPTMTLDRIKSLKIPAADDCVLFLWATVPMLPEALSVMDAWGFKYKSHCVWDKQKQGTGYWFRNVHELLLVGTRGNVPAPAMGTQPVSVIEAPASRHSVKPTIFQEIIESFFPNCVRLEMFARSKRKGWDGWGNEVEDVV